MKEELKGIEYVSSYAKSQQVLKAYGRDVLFLFQQVALTSLESKLRYIAATHGRTLALAWRRLQRVPRDPGILIDTAMADRAADKLGERDKLFSSRLQARVSTDNLIEYLGFDPREESPPSDVPDYCARCASGNVRGQRTCAQCGMTLEVLSRYRTWAISLVVIHHFEQSSPKVDIRYFDVLRWVHYMRPYPEGNVAYDGEAWEAAYAITHLIYTLNDFGVWLLPRSRLKPEYNFLRRCLEDAIEAEDIDLVGECVDTLASFGLSRRGAILYPGVRFLRSSQNSDGSWGGISDEEFDKFHMTWTAIDGLRTHAWKGRKEVKLA